MNENYGKLLVSTKPTAGRKAAVGFCCVLFVLFGIFMFIDMDPLREITFKSFHNAELGTIWGIVMGVICLSMPVFFVLGLRSGCNVYEGGVTGTTATKKVLQVGTAKNFSVSYNDIVNVSDTKTTLVIQTKYEQFEVMAQNSSNRAAALREIRAKMQGNLT